MKVQREDRKVGHCPVCGRSGEESDRWIGEEPHTLLAAVLSTARTHSRACEFAPRHSLLVRRPLLPLSQDADLRFDRFGVSAHLFEFWCQDAATDCRVRRPLNRCVPPSPPCRCQETSDEALRMRRQTGAPDLHCSSHTFSTRRTRRNPKSQPAAAGDSPSARTYTQTEWRPCDGSLSLPRGTVRPFPSPTHPSPSPSPGTRTRGAW